MVHELLFGALAVTLEPFAGISLIGIESLQTKFLVCGAA